MRHGEQQLGNSDTGSAVPPYPPPPVGNARTAERSFDSAKKLVGSVLFAIVAIAVLSIGDHARPNRHSWESDALFKIIMATGATIGYAGINLVWLWFRFAKSKISMGRLAVAAVLAGVLVPLLSIGVRIFGNIFGLGDKLINPAIGFSMLAVPLVAAEAMYRLAKAQRGFHVQR